MLVTRCHEGGRATSVTCGIWPWIVNDADYHDKDEAYALFQITSHRAWWAIHAHFMASATRPSKAALGVGFLPAIPVTHFSVETNRKTHQARKFSRLFFCSSSARGVQVRASLSKSRCPWQWNLSFGRWNGWVAVFLAAFACFFITNTAIFLTFEEILEDFVELCSQNSLFRSVSWFSKFAQILAIKWKNSVSLKCSKQEARACRLQALQWRD